MRAGASTASGRPRHPGTATTTSGSRSSPTPPASRCRIICCGSSSWRASRRASWRSRAPSSMPSATTATSPSRSRRSRRRCARRSSARRGEVERVLAARAGARSARRRRALGRRVHRAAAAAARSGDPGLRHRASQIARHHLELVAERELSLLRRELRATEEELAAALALVRSCHPRPGATVSAGSAEYVVPDVFVRRTDHGWAVEINAATLPRVRLNQQLRQPHRPQRQPRDHARAAAGGALAAQEPGDPPRDAHEGRALHRRAPDRVPRARRRAHAADDPQGHRRGGRACTSRPSRA